MELAGHRNVIGMVEDGLDVARVVAAGGGNAGKFQREVTVTMVFAAVTGRMKAKAAPEQLVSAEGLTGGAAVGGAAERCEGAADADEEGGLSDAGRTYGGDAGGARGGCGGCDAGVGASAPQACYEVLAAWKDGDPALAAEKQDRVQSWRRGLRRSWACGH